MIPSIIIPILLYMLWWAYGSINGETVLDNRNKLLFPRNWFTRWIFSTMRIRVTRLGDEAHYISYRFAFTPWEKLSQPNLMSEPAAREEAGRVIAKLSRWLYTSDYKRVPFKVLRPSKEKL